MKTADNSIKHEDESMLVILSEFNFLAFSPLLSVGTLVHMQCHALFEVGIISSLVST